MMGGALQWLPMIQNRDPLILGRVLMFLTTLSFLFSAPGWEPSLGGFPAVSASVGQFPLKDVVLLGAAIWTFGRRIPRQPIRRPELATSAEEPGASSQGEGLPHGAETW